MQRRRDDFADLPCLDRPSVLADDLDEHVVVADVIGIAVRTFPRQQVEFVRAVEIDQRCRERGLDRAPCRGIEDLAAGENQPRFDFFAVGKSKAMKLERDEKGGRPMIIVTLPLVDASERPMSRPPLVIYATLGRDLPQAHSNLAAD